jgi:hypothetical protein
MIVLVCGGRDFTDYNWLANTLEAAIVYGKMDITQIIHGNARGADRLADRWASKMGIPCRRFDADWKTHRRKAGPIRNQQMIDEGKPDLVIAFPGPPGTADMTARAKRHGIPVTEVVD